MAYHQILMSDAYEDKRSVCSPHDGLYHYTRMPFGLCNAAATFQRDIDQALNRLKCNIIVLYLDDITVYRMTFDEHLDNLSAILDRIQFVNLKLKPKKCNFLRREVRFLRHLISEEDIKTYPSNN